MCMEDVRIGRKTLSRSVVFVLPAAGQEVLSGSDMRTALVLAAPIAGNVTYLDQSNAASGSGIVLAASQAPLILTLQDHGDIVRHQWWATPDAANRIVAVIETLLQEK